MEVRLNKFLATQGIASRRKADLLIESGEVTVNGKRVFELGVKIDPSVDKVKVNGKLVQAKSEELLYLMFHKPKNVITSLEDPLGRPTITDYLARLKTKVFPVGRLDWDSEGLLLLTNDGDFANQVSHPKYNIPKRYLVKIGGKITPTMINKMKRGMSIPEGGRVSAKRLERIAKKSTPQNDWLIIEITEGKNRQIRKMFGNFKLDVLKLHGVAIGGLELGTLKRGEFKVLLKKDLEKIFEDPHKEKKTKLKSKKIISEND
ncbi:MAG: rRNA pseudouridine synthase [Bdellovibrionales bacterium]|nr:rRNA pseudouridine synthase [Bdellovibrionales bacterium]